MRHLSLLIALLTFTVCIVRAQERPILPLVANPGIDAEIVRIEDRRAYGPELQGYFASPDPEVRRKAALAAGRIGEPQSIGPLGGLLRDSDSSVRAAAAFALGEIEDSLAADPLALLLLAGREEDPLVRAAAIEALGKLQADERATLCVAALDDPAREVREAACLASWMMQAEDAVDRLLALTEDPADELRWKATYALMRMLGAPVSGRTSIPGGTELSLENKDRIESVLVARLTDSDARVRMTALRGVRRLEDGPTADAVAVALNDFDWRVRVEAIRSVAAYFRERAETTSVSPRAIDLTASLHDENPNVRLAAIGALGVPGVRSDAEQLLYPILHGASARETQVAALSLAHLSGAMEKTEPAAQKRIRAIASDLAASEDWSMRATAAEVLEAGGVYDSLLYATLLHDDPRVAKTAVEPFLAHLASTRVTASPILSSLRADLDRLLDATDPVLRAVTLEAVGTILGDSIPATEQASWIGLLRSAWKDARADHGNDVALVILDLIEEQAESPAAREILDWALQADDELVRREAVRILRDAGIAEPDAGAGAIDPRRSLREYASILKWAEAEHQVEIVTGRGTIRLVLFAREAPLTCWNFAWLAGSGFYDEGAWHRIVPDFVVQDGCPRGDGWGGPDHQIRCEINQHRYVTGTIGMALSGKDTGGSQFFITHSPQPHLDGRYTVFGQVVEGQEIVDTLIQRDRIETVRLLKTTGSEDQPGQD